MIYKKVLYGLIGGLTPLNMAHMPTDLWTWVQLGTTCLLSMCITLKALDSPSDNSNDPTPPTPSVSATTSK